MSLLSYRVKLIVSFTYILILLSANTAFGLPKSQSCRFLIVEMARSDTFTKDNGQKAMVTLDLEALKLIRHSFVSQERFTEAIKRPFLDSEEIKSRQRAVQEIQHQLLDKLSKIFNSMQSENWRNFYYREKYS